MSEIKCFLVKMENSNLGKCNMLLALLTRRKHILLPASQQHIKYCTTIYTVINHISQRNNPSLVKTEKKLKP